MESCSGAHLLSWSDYSNPQMPERSALGNTFHGNDPKSHVPTVPGMSGSVSNSQTKSCQVSGAASLVDCIGNDINTAPQTAVSAPPACISPTLTQASATTNSGEEVCLGGMELLFAWEGRLAFGARLLDALLEGDRSVKVCCICECLVRMRACHAMTSQVTVLEHKD